ncbi:hypothetical protein WSM22_30610 [Cytophagales bacterium WSM2-2]|nr:hypothetical protein WSM22_30610 [Cytophagales bacterium WSM2-2]
MTTKTILLTAFYLTLSSSSFAQNNSKMKNINNNAPVKCSKEITINASSEKVWSVLTGINNWTKWQKEIIRSRLNGELKQNTTFDWRSGSVNIHSTLHTVEVFKNIGWTGNALGTFVIHNWTLTEDNGQIKVSVDESMEGFFASVFKKKFNRNLEKVLGTWLDLLKQECEKDVPVANRQTAMHHSNL